MSLAYAWHCIPPLPVEGNQQRDKHWPWHGIWQDVHGPMYFQRIGFHGNWMHVNLWKVPWFNDCKAMLQWLTIGTQALFVWDLETVGQ